MSDTLLSYFEQELRFIREEASQFSARHPGAADALGIKKDSIDDPQIARLIESIAFLNGKLQQRLDDSFPEFTESLIRLLFPHYLRPVPSYSLLDFVVGDGTNATHHIPVGTEFEVRDDQTASAVFRTTEDVTLFPLKIENVNVSFAPFELAKPKSAEQSNALIEISISAVDDTVVLSELLIESLKLHFKGETSFALRLFDLLSQDTSQICVSAQGKSYELGRNAMEPIGFDVSDTILPYQAASFGGFKLLTEFFMFSERFNGFKFNFGDVLKQIGSHQFKLQIFIDELSVDFARNLSVERFSLFTTPIVNLHQMVSDPLEIDFLKKQYPIVLDVNQGHSLELFSVDEVMDVTQAESVKIAQIYGEKFNRNESGLRWQLVQTLHENGLLEGALKVADLEHISAESEPLTWLVNATVTDGMVASHLSLLSEIECRESLTIPADIQLLRRPSLPMRSKETNKNVWALLCHLHFNYHAILGSDHPVETLKNVFDLYNHNQNLQNHAYIESVTIIEQEQVVAPIRVSGKTCFAYGTKITITLDPTSVNGGLCLFAHLLERFFAYFAGFNSFTQVDIKLKGQDELYMAFPRRAGCKSLL